MTDLFTIEESRPPRIVELRRAYDAAKSVYDEATADAAPCGKAPDALYDAFVDAEAALRQEEARIATNNKL